MSEGKSVPSELYDEEYFLTWVEGYEYFLKSRGRDVPPRLKKALDMANITDLSRVLDIACGRGEVCFHAGMRGAQVVGLDYSAVAVDIASRALARFPEEVQRRTLFLHGNCKSLPLVAEDFDIVFMLDLVEHLYPEELHVALCEARRVLKEGGLLIVHTSPNLLYNNYVVPMYTRWIRYVLYYPIKRLLDREVKLQDRTTEEMAIHVNEQSPSGLREMLIAAGFQPHRLKKSMTILPGAIKDYFVRREWYQILAGLLVTAWPLCLVWPFSLFLKSNIWVIGVKE